VPQGGQLDLQLAQRLLEPIEPFVDLVAHGIRLANASNAPLTSTGPPD
jgi:hypothetical protein